MFGISWLTDKIAAGIAGFLLVSTIALGIGLVVTRTTLHTRTVELQAEKVAHEADIQKWAAATATAQLQDQQHSDAVKAAQDKITTENSNALDTKLSDAHAAVADFVRKQAADDKRGSSASNLPAAPDATGKAAAADQSAVVSVDDLNACAEAVTIAEGWQAWYSAQLAVNRDDATSSISQERSQPEAVVLPTQSAGFSSEIPQVIGDKQSLGAPVVFDAGQFRRTAGE